MSSFTLKSLVKTQMDDSKLESIHERPGQVDRAEPEIPTLRHFEATVGVFVPMHLGNKPHISF